jgi:hypothetical protein
MSNAQTQKKTQWNLFKWTLPKNMSKMYVNFKPSNFKRYIWRPFHFLIQNIYIDYNIEQETQKIFFELDLSPHLWQVISQITSHWSSCLIWANPQVYIKCEIIISIYQKFQLNHCHVRDFLVTNNSTSPPRCKHEICIALYYIIRSILVFHKNVIVKLYTWFLIKVCKLTTKHINVHMLQVGS